MTSVSLMDVCCCRCLTPVLLWPGTVFRSVGHEVDLCAGGLEVDYKGDEVGHGIITKTQSTQICFLYLQ